MSINYKKTTIEKDKIVFIKYNQYYTLVKAQELDDGDVIPLNQKWKDHWNVNYIDTQIFIDIFIHSLDYYA